jgi:hypothetical protein
VANLRRSPFALDDHLSGIACVVRRVEQNALTDRQLADKLKKLKDEIYRLQS